MEFLTERLLSHARRVPDKTAVWEGERSLTYAELAAYAYAVSRALEELGCGADSVIVPEATPTTEYVRICLGIHLLGGVHVPVENRIPDDRLAEIAERVSAELLISAHDPACGIRHITPAELLARAEKYVLSWTPETPVGAPRMDERGEILFTTGSTGRSKGVVHSRRGMTAYVQTINASLRMHEGTVLLVVTPLNHAGGLHRLYMTLYAGGTLVLMDGLKNLAAFYDTIARRGVNTLYLPPSGVHILLLFSAKQLAALDGKLDFVFTASAPFPESEREKMCRLLPSTRLIEAYGGSEVGSVCNYNYNDPTVRQGCIGKPYDCVEVRLAGEDGLIQIKSPMTMMGYLDDPELTASVFDGEWFMTSDCGRLDEDGYLYFLGRNDDVINIGGKKVAPSELEDAALRCEGVSDCACVGVADATAGTMIKLLVVMKNGCAFDPKRIVRELRTRVEDYKLPALVEETDAIPRLFNGKINRKELRRTQQ